jgi:hypothetical protein
MSPAQMTVATGLLARRIRRSLGHWPVEARSKAIYGFQQERSRAARRLLFSDLLKVETI